MAFTCIVCSLPTHIDTHTHVLNKIMGTAYGRNPAPVDVDIPVFSEGFIHPRWLFGISSINSIPYELANLPEQDILLFCWSWTLFMNIESLELVLSKTTPFEYLHLISPQKSLRKGELLFYVGRVDVQKGSITVGIQSFPVPRRWAFLLSSWCFCQMYDSTKRCWTSNFLV